MAETASNFENTPEGWARRWHLELETARKALKKFYDVGKEEDNARRDETPEDVNSSKRVCLYPSNIQVLSSLLYGRMPQASVGRKFADADDDVARVAAEMLERILNCDIQRGDDTFAEATQNNVLDYLGPGLGVQRHRYELGPLEEVPGTPEIKDEMTGAVIAPEVPPSKRKTWERVDTDYVYWGDYLWGQCRVWAEVPWLGFLVQMSQEKMVEKFGKELGMAVPLNSKAKSKDRNEDEKAQPWDRADVWEIWHKETKKVFWVVEGFDKVLGQQDDPLGLEGFFPCQRPMMANLTTNKLVPVSNYKFSQDLYKSVNMLTTRIAMLTEAIGVKGGYDKAAGADLANIVKAGPNKLFPVDNWAMFAEKGGIKGVIDMMPLDPILQAILGLMQQRQADIDLIYQVTGQADVMRGQQTVNGTPGEAQVKAKFGSVRVQAMQDELARFASDGQRIRAEIISKHFDPETIIKHSNIERTPDAPLAMQAAQLLKDRFAEYRIEIKPEAINLMDFAAQKQDAIEVIGAMSTYFAAAQGLVQAVPGAMPFVLQMLKPLVSRLKGADAFEGIIDNAIKQAEAAAHQPQQQQEDPKMQVERAKLANQQMKGQADMQKEQFKHQAKLQEIAAEVDADAQREATQAAWNTREAQAKAAISAAHRPPPQANGRPKP